MTSGEVVTLADVVALARRLSASDKARLIEQMAAGLQHDVALTEVAPLRSLYGLCADLCPAPSAEEIDEARREAWAGAQHDDSQRASGHRG